MLANIEVDKVADMEMDKVVDIVADMEVYKDICVTRVICGTYSIESLSHLVFVFALNQLESFILELYKFTTSCSFLLGKASSSSGRQDFR